MIARRTEERALVEVACVLGWLLLHACTLPDVALAPAVEEPVYMTSAPPAGVAGAVPQGAAGTGGSADEPPATPTTDDAPMTDGADTMSAADGGPAPVGGQSGGGDDPPPAPTDPCMVDNGGCDTEPMVTCVNQAGVAQCTCPPGFAGSGVGTDGCSDIDECMTKNGGCDTSPMSTCTNGAPGSVVCSCPTGYVGNGVGDAGCGDSNECLNNNGGCDETPMATCSNQAGAKPTCSCPLGYTGNGVGTSGCTDQNECLNTNGGCDTTPMATCTNTAGSRTCACPDGYTGNGIGQTGCTDINECLTRNGGCDMSPMATCSNTGGERTCTCPAGTSTGSDAEAGTICGRFIYTDSWVHDYEFELTWQRIVPGTYAGCTASYHGEGTSGEACSWSQAKDYCANLSLNSNTGWRLPTANELLSIVNSGATGEAKTFPDSFPDTPAAHFWTSGSYDTANAYYVCFCDGVSDWEPVAEGNYVRCVLDW